MTSNRQPRKVNMANNREKTGERNRIASSNLFDRCVEWKLMKDGSYECHCKLGLWGVSGPNRETVAQEAMHYWTQYWLDGEYSKHLSNKALTQPSADK